MTPQQYLNQSSRTDLQNSQRDAFGSRINGCDIATDLLHATMGLCTESAEALDVMKKHLAYGKPIDTVNLLEEIGDMLWYVAIILRRTDKSFEDVMQMNINKLEKRFPEKFTEQAALNRNLDAERSQLEKDM